MYNKNKDSLTEEFKTIQYTEITPQGLSGNSEYDESFFKQLDILENKVLDGQSFEETSKENNFEVTVLKDININKKDRNKKEVKNLSDSIFKKIYSIKNEKTPQVLKIDGKYYLAEIISILREKKSINDPDVIELIKAQLKFRYKIEFNSSIAKDLSLGGFDKVKIESFAKENNLDLRNYEITNLKQNEIFSEGIIKRIYATKDGNVDLITDSNLTKNFLVLGVKTQYKTLDKKSKQFEQYEAKARLNLINNIFKTYDEDLNNKYKVELNKKTIDRVKNSF
jgi:peptidyl-prolyl cis-trans isomerase D